MVAPEEVACRICDRRLSEDDAVLFLKHYYCKEHYLAQIGSKEAAGSRRVHGALPPGIQQPSRAATRADQYPGLRRLAALHEVIAGIAALAALAGVVAGLALLGQSAAAGTLVIVVAVGSDSLTSCGRLLFRN